MQLPPHSYNQPSRVPSRLVNIYAQQSVSTKGPVELVSAPGIASWASLPGPGRGMIAVAGVLYAVGGTGLYRVSSGGSVELLGTVPGTGRLTLAANDVGEIVTSNGYLYDGSTVAAISDPDVVPFAAVDYLDGYIVAVEANTDRFVCSDLRDASSWDALNYSGTIGNADKLLTLKVDHNQVLLFGGASIEIFWNSGVSGFPFERMAGGYLEIGCLAPLGVAKADNSVYWLANDRTIRRLTGQTPVRVSQHGVEEKLATYATVSDCVAFSWMWNGHTFVTFRFPSADACWTLDALTGEWHERASYGYGDWLIADAAQCYGKQVVQHATTGAVGYFDADTWTEWGGILRREWTYPEVYAANTLRFHSNFEIVLRTGTAAIGTTPYVTLEVSNDGGNTWYELPRREVGQVGEYSQRVRWARLGSSRDRVYRCSIADPLPVYVLGTEVTVA